MRQSNSYEEVALRQMLPNKKTDIEIDSCYCYAKTLMKKGSTNLTCPETATAAVTAKATATATATATETETLPSMAL